MNTKISIIIPTIRDNLYLKALLEALNQQTFNMSEAEVLVVADAKDKSTLPDISLTKTVYLLKQFRNQQKLGPAGARNIGIKESTGEIIAFIDDDCLPPVDWIEKIAAHFKNKDTQAIAGRIEPYETKTMIQRYCKFANILNIPKQIETNKALYLITANCALRKNLLEQLNYFNEAYSFAGEDLDLSYRIRKKGIAISYVPEILVYHHHSPNFLTWLKKYFLYGRGCAQFEVSNQTAELKEYYGKNFKWTKAITLFKIPLKIFNNLKQEIALKDALSFPIISYIMNAAFILGKIYENLNKKIKK